MDRGKPWKSGDLRFCILIMPMFLMGCVSVADNKLKSQMIGIHIPIISITQYTDNRRILLKGNIFPLKNNGSAFDLTDGAEIKCEGETSPKGVGEMQCANASDGTLYVIKMNIPKKSYGTLNGSYVDTGPDGEITAVGWGRDAAVDKLQIMLAAAVSKSNT